jgi:hypothetical protein
MYARLLLPLLRCCNRAAGHVDASHLLASLEKAWLPTDLSCMMRSTDRPRRRIFHAWCSVLIRWIVSYRSDRPENRWSWKIFNYLFIARAGANSCCIRLRFCSMDRNLVVYVSFSFEHRLLLFSMR